MIKVLTYLFLLVLSTSLSGQTKKFKELRFNYIPDKCYVDKDKESIYFLGSYKDDNVLYCNYEVDVSALKYNEYEEVLGLYDISNSVFEDIRKATFEFANKRQQISLCPSMMVAGDEIVISANTHKYLREEDLLLLKDSFAVSGLFQGRQSYTALIKGAQYVYHIFVVTTDESDPEIKKILSGIEFK